MDEMQLLRRHHDGQPAPSAAAVEAARARLAACERPGPIPLRRRRYVLAASGVAAVAAAAVVVPAMVDGGGGVRAYAADRASDGTVRVTIREFTDSKGLQLRLRKLGVNASITYLPGISFCLGSRGTTVGNQPEVVLSPYSRPPYPKPGTPMGDQAFTIRPWLIKPGQTLVWTLNFDKGMLKQTRGTSMGVSAFLVSGPVQRCEIRTFPGLRR